MNILDLLDDLPDGASPADPLEVAARKLRSAVESYPGRRRSVVSWRKAVGPWLGKKRLGQPLYQQVIDTGIRLGLFEIDSDSGAYPFFVLLDPPVEEPEPDEAEVDEAEVEEPEAEVEEPEAEVEEPEEIEADAPDESEEPKSKGSKADMMDCGHMSWDSPTRAPTDCEKCLKGMFGHPSGMKGKYAKRPVPEKRRRTLEKENQPGWPGYCSHPKTHAYIGGIGNDCRYYSGGKIRCVVHQHKKRRKYSDEG